MAYQTIKAENVALSCCIKVSCVSTGEAVGAVESVILKKKYAGTTIWKNVATIPIIDMNDFTFTYYDVDTRSGYKYDYIAIPIINNTENPGVSSTCACLFEGTYIGDATGAFISLYNNEYTKQKNIQTAYITTISGRYPRRVSNAGTNYYSGTITGLFLPFDQCHRPLMEKAMEYKAGLLEFLTNGTTKLLKTGDGNAWLVAIDGTPKENYSPFVGVATTTFSWTEVGALPAPPNTLEDSEFSTYLIPYNPDSDGRLFHKNENGVLVVN